MKCCEIKLGDLNRQVQIFENVQTRQATGGYSTTWVLYASPWCRIKTKSGTEVSHGDQLDAIATLEFVTRYRNDLTESMKITYRGEDYQIRLIENIEERDEWTRIKAQRGEVQ